MSESIGDWEILSASPLELYRRGRVWTVRTLVGLAVAGTAAMVPLVLWMDHGDISASDLMFLVNMVGMFAIIGTGFFGMLDGKGTVYINVRRSLRITDNAGQTLLVADGRRFVADRVPVVQVARRESRDQDGDVTTVHYFAVVPLPAFGLELRCDDRDECSRLATTIAEALGDAETDFEPGSQGSWAAEYWVVGLVVVPMMLGGSLLPFAAMIYEWGLGAWVVLAVAAALGVYIVCRLISAWAARRNLAKRRGS